MVCGDFMEDTDDHWLGKYWGDDVPFKSIGTLRKGTYGVDYGDYLFEEVIDSEYGEPMYLAMSPVFVDEELRYVVCLGYDWSSFAQILEKNLRSIVLWTAISLLAVNALLILFMYLQAVRPMVRVNDGVRQYMKDKDSRAVVDRMSKIRAKNEAGMLADSIAELSVEIDRYTEENLRLNGEQERIAAEMDLARDIQADNLPTAFPDRKDIQLAASMVPAKKVGGDFYDFFFIDDDHLGLVIADVSGNGAGAVSSA